MCFLVICCLGTSVSKPLLSLLEKGEDGSSFRDDIIQLHRFMVFSATYTIYEGLKLDAYRLQSVTSLIVSMILFINITCSSEKNQNKLQYDISHCTLRYLKIMTVLC